MNAKLSKPAAYLSLSLASFAEGNLEEAFSLFVEGMDIFTNVADEKLVTSGAKPVVIADALEEVIASMDTPDVDDDLLMEDDQPVNENAEEDTNEDSEPEFSLSSRFAALASARA